MFYPFSKLEERVPVDVLKKFAEHFTEMHGAPKDASWDACKKHFGKDFKQMMAHMSHDDVDVCWSLGVGKEPPDQIRKLAHGTAELTQTVQGECLQFPTRNRKNQPTSQVIVNGGKPVKWAEIDDLTRESSYQQQQKPPCREKAHLNWPNQVTRGAKKGLLHYFYLLMPDEVVNSFVEHTSASLVSANKKPIDQREFFRFLGFCYMMCAMPQDRRDYYFLTEDKIQRDPKLRGLMPYDFERKYGLNESRINEIFKHLNICPQGTTDKWLPVTTFVDAYNECRSRVLVCGKEMCIDESMSGYRGKDGAIAGDGMPHVTKHPHKPVSVGMEFVDVSDVESGIIARLEVSQGKAMNATKKWADRYPYHVGLCLRLTEPWHHVRKPIVLNGDSRFSSVESTVALAEHGVYYRGIVKNCSKFYPKAAANKHEFQERGDSYVLKTTVNDGILVHAICWGDKKRRDLVGTALGLEQGDPHNKCRLDHLGNHKTKYNKEAKKVPRLKGVQDHIESARSIDDHNYFRQGRIRLEQVWRVMNLPWHQRPWASLFGMVATDAKNGYCHFEGQTMTALEFVRLLAFDLLLDNDDADGCRSEGAVGSHSSKKSSKESCFSKSPQQLSAIDASPLALSPPHSGHTIRSLSELEGCPRSCGYSTSCSVCKVRFPGSKIKGGSYCVECSKIDEGMLCVVCGSGSQRGADCISYHMRNPQHHIVSLPGFMRSDRSQRARKRRKVGAAKK